MTISLLPLKLVKIWLYRIISTVLYLLSDWKARILRPKIHNTRILPKVGNMTLLPSPGKPGFYGVGLPGRVILCQPWVPNPQPLCHTPYHKPWANALQSELFKKFFNKHSQPRSGCPSLLVSFADSLCKQFVSDQDLQKTHKMYIPNVLTLIVFLKFFIDFEQKNQSADSKKACTITQRANSEYILILTRGILFCLDISDIYRTKSS